MKTYTQSLYDYLKSKGNEEIARAQSQYMRNRFPFIGIMKPDAEAFAKAFFEENSKPNKAELIEFTYACLAYPEREMWHVALDLLRKNAAHLQPKHLEDVKEFVIKGDWWDTTDSIATKVVGTMVKKHPQLKKEMDQWILHPNFWIRRIAIIHQLTYRNDTDFEQLKKYILLCNHEKEFFIQKAIGWALREYSKYNPTAVIEFIDATPLAPLSVREGLRILKKKNII